MPLDKSGSKKSIGTNLKLLASEGYGRKQALAIALKTAREAGADVPKPKKKRKKKS